MNAQCSPEPYRLTVDGRLEKSGLYHQMKSFKTKSIEDIITSLMEKVFYLLLKIIIIFEVMLKIMLMYH